MPADLRPGHSATAELFRLRRIEVVDAGWHSGFVIGFLVAGLLAFAPLATGLGRAPALAMAQYIATIFIAGIACGVIGKGVGHAVATAWERIDLRKHPRRYEGERPR